MADVQLLNGFMPKVGVAIKNFFDRDAVLDRLPAATRKSLSKAGAYIRSDAIRAINRHTGKKPKVKVVDEKGRPVFVRNKKGKQVELSQRDSSKPGEAPMSQVGLLKKFLFFSHDQSTNSVVIGPALINSPSGAPETLEFGGTITTLVRYQRLDSQTVMRLSKPRRESVNIAKRPYMGPALEKNMSVVAEVWKNSL